VHRSGMCLPMIWELDKLGCCLAAGVTKVCSPLAPLFIEGRAWMAKYREEMRVMVGVRNLALYCTKSVSKSRDQDNETSVALSASDPKCLMIPTSILWFLSLQHI